MQCCSAIQLQMSPTPYKWCVSLPSIAGYLMWKTCWWVHISRAYCIHKYCLTSSSPVSWVFGWRRARCSSRSRENVKRSWRLTPRLRETAPWLLLTRSWWTWAPPPRTHLHPRHRGDGGGDGRHPGPPRHPAAPFSPVATVGSCWLRPHLKREGNQFSKRDLPPGNWSNTLP